VNRLALQRRYTSQNTLYEPSLVQLPLGIGQRIVIFMQEGSCWLIKAAFRRGVWRKPLGVVREEAIRRGEGGSH
jgi:hypothetical protein